jgi:DNA-directed RNA polymerase subunit RPC12/RpoP
MPNVIIPKNANSVACPSCGAKLTNLAKLGVRHQVDCRCGAKVIVERRQASSTVHIEHDRRPRRQTGSK